MDSYFLLCAFRIFPLNFAILKWCAWCGCVWIPLVWGNLCASCTWISISSFRFWKFPAVISSRAFSIRISLSPSAAPSRAGWCALYDPVVCCLHFSSLCLCCSGWVISHVLSARPLTRSSALSSLLLMPWPVFTSGVDLSGFDWFLFTVSVPLTWSAFTCYCSFPPIFQEWLSAAGLQCGSCWCDDLRVYWYS